MADKIVINYLENVKATIHEPSNFEELDPTFIKSEPVFKPPFSLHKENPLDDKENVEKNETEARTISNNTGIDTELDLTETLNDQVKEEPLDRSSDNEELIETHEHFVEDIREHDSRLKVETLEIAKESMYVLPEGANNVQQTFLHMPFEDDKPIQYPLHEQNYNVNEAVLDPLNECVQDFEFCQTTDGEIYEQDCQMKEEPLENVEHVSMDNVECDRTNLLLQNNENNLGNIEDDDTPAQEQVEVSKKTIESNNETRQYGCRYCETKFFTRYQFHGHFKTCTKTKFTTSCGVCGAGYVTKRGLQMHKRSHFSDGQLKCPACNNTHLTEEELINHITDQHKGEKLYKCNTCEKRFTRVKPLKLHLRIHNKATLLCCRMCPRKCKTKSSLTLHMRVHVARRTVACTVCGRKCTSLWHLTQHQRIHNKAKYFPCLICERKYCFRGNLKRHMRVHAGKKASLTKNSSYVDKLVSLSATGGAPLKEEDLDLPTGQLLQTDEIVSLPAIGGAPLKEEDLDLPTGQLLQTDENFEEKMNVEEYTVRFSDEVRLTHDENNIPVLACEDAEQLQTNENLTVNGGVSLLEKVYVDPKDTFLDETFHFKQEVLDLPFEYIHSFESRDTSQGEINKYDYEMKFDPLEDVEDNVEYDKRDTEKLMQGHEEVPKNAIKSKKAKRQLYQCRCCKLTFAKSKQLKHHTKVCTNYVYVCRVCGAGYTTLRGMRLHRETHLCDGKPKCPACSKLYDTDEELINHLLEHRGEKLFKCKKCDKSFDRERELKTHVHVHKRVKLLHCGKCSRQFKTKSGLLKHSRIFQCELRPQSRGICSNNAALLNKTLHTCTHNLVQPLTCRICDIKFISKGQLMHHMRTHNGKRKTFTCTTCQASFVIEKSMTLHGLLCHNVVAALECFTCGDDFPTQTSLLVHMAGHDMSATPYFCPTCEKPFNTLASWASHMRQNVWLRTFSCASCDEKFASNRTLGQHVLREHANNTSTFFIRCGTTFTKKVNLAGYVRDVQTSLTVSNKATLPIVKKKYRQIPLPVSQVLKCSKCSLIFLNEISFKHHTSHCYIYSPHQCARCRRLFATYRSWLDHTNAMDCVIRYECIVCKKIYVCSRMLRVHMLSHDSSSPEICFEESIGLSVGSKPTHLTNLDSISSADSLSSAENRGVNSMNITTNKYPESYSMNGSTSSLINECSGNSQSASISTPGNRSITRSMYRNNSVTTTTDRVFVNNSFHRLNIFRENAENTAKLLPNNSSINNSILLNKNSEDTGSTNRYFNNGSTNSMVNVSSGNMLNTFIGTAGNSLINNSIVFNKNFENTGTMNRYFNKNSTSTMINVSSGNTRTASIGTPGKSSKTNSIVFNNNSEYTGTMNSLTGQLYNVPSISVTNSSPMYNKNSVINLKNVFHERSTNTVNRLPDNSSVNNAMVYCKNSENTGSMNSLSGQLNNLPRKAAINSSTLFCNNSGLLHYQPGNNSIPKSTYCRNKAKIIVILNRDPPNHS